METKDCKEMSNNEIKLYIYSLENLFEMKKMEIKKMCDDLVEIEEEYKKCQNELNIRKTIY